MKVTRLTMFNYLLRKSTPLQVDVTTSQADLSSVIQQEKSLFESSDEYLKKYDKNHNSRELRILDSFHLIRSRRYFVEKIHGYSLRISGLYLTKDLLDGVMFVSNSRTYLM